MRPAAILCAAGLGAALAASAPALAAEAAGHGAAPGVARVLRAAIGFDLGGANVKALLIDGDRTWLGTSDGLIRFDNLSGEQRLYDNSNGLLSNGVFHVGKLQDRIWVGTYGGGLSILDPETETWRRYNIPEGLGDSFVYDVMADPRGDVWIATWSGVNQVIGGALDDPAAWRLHTVASTKGGLVNDWVYALASGPDGAVWLATEGGLVRHHEGSPEGTWRSWTHADGLGAPWEIVAAHQEKRLASSAASRHHQRQRREQGLENAGPAYNPNYVVSLHVDAEGVVWAGTWGAGLSRFDGKSWRSFTVADGLPGDHVFALGASNGRLWIGTNRGLASYDGAKFEDLSRAAGLNVASVFAIAIAEESAWIGGYGGATWYPRGVEAVLAGNEGDGK